MSQRPKYSLKLNPAQVIRHGDAIAAFCLSESAHASNPYDFTVEYRPGTQRPTGRLLFHHPGQTIVVRDFVIALDKDPAIP